MSYDYAYFVFTVVFIICSYFFLLQHTIIIYMIVKNVRINDAHIGEFWCNVMYSRTLYYIRVLL